MNIGTIIRMNRKKRGMTLNELSKKSGVSLSFISDIENGRRLPGLEKSKAIADALSIDVKLINQDIASILNEITYDIESITDPNINAIVRASKYLNPDQCLELRKLAERLYPFAFIDIK
ncbi:helix-turn-helix domain-containing protein [Clostridium faecium]|uniref:Helix-turn-helix transcriptional regulator n=1 Tax=Clostridium faecium TaxID=2762223 RepID=A0ABR8YNR5_9CLOT|nr:helix-turn-helix transcriptional regulator [Clostridium faecium]MBD8045831.1 helix-turn-helix transcriptional regulator [Clostridium faecium]